MTVDAGAKLFGAEELQYVIKLAHQGYFGPMKWSTIAPLAVGVKEALFPFFQNIPALRRDLLMREYEQVVAEYTPDQTLKFLDQKDKEMKKKLVLCIALSELVIKKSAEESDVAM